MAIRLETRGTRIYFIGDTFAAKSQIKDLGAHWDMDARSWWIGKAKLAAAEKLVAELSAPPAHVQVAAASVGLSSDAPAHVVADKVREELGDKAADAVLAKPKQDPDDIRLTGKGRYKGREYYAGSITRDGQKVRLLTLPDADGKFLDFWAFCSEVEQTKKYEPREVWDGRRYSGRTVTQYTTLGSIAKFIRRQKNPDTARVQCHECDAWHNASESCHECGGC